jgi:predicted  nucleic acid-binding Zn-ribbon protein
MGIFGFLSKAHMDQGVPTGDIAAQISLIDEKINTQKEYIKSERENINSARTALGQMDAQVSARLDRGTSEASAERSVQIRAQQRRERAALNKEISEAQGHIETANAEIAKLNLERAPIASKFRKVEAEVGPIKYIAALIYGDNPDQALLERAVRWVIILLIFVFDPLALMLVIAAISSYKWEFENKREEFVPSVTNTGYMPLSPSERENGLNVFEPEPETPKVVPRVMGKPVLDHKATNFEAALGPLGKTITVEEETKPKLKGLKKRVQNAQNKLKNLVSQVKDLKSKLVKSNLTSEESQSPKLSLKEKLSWKNLTQWNNSPVLLSSLKLYYNLKNKIKK